MAPDEWLRTHFFPLIESMPSASDGDQPTPVTAFVAARLLGAVDALAEVGFLDAEQEQRCRAAMEPKGISTTKVTHSSFAFVSGITLASGEPEAAAVEEPDRLVRVIGDGRTFGLLAGEQAVLSSVEIWQRRVRAGILIAASPSLELERMERADEMRAWLERRQAGEATDDLRPPHPSGPPGRDATWVLEAGGRQHDGALVSGQGGSGHDWWRIDVEWQVALEPDCREVDITAAEAGRVIGRSTLRW